MSLLELIVEHDTRETLEAALQEYAAEHSAEQLLSEIRKQPKTKSQVSQRLRDTDTQFLLFQLVTGYEALEEITMLGKEGKPGYHSLRGLVALLFEEKLTASETGQRLRQLAEKQEMPLLTQQHQEYIQTFTVEYVEGISTGRLQEELGLGSGVSISPIHSGYSPFLAKLSEKIRKDPSLQFAVLKKYTGYEALEEITSMGKERKPGYKSLAGLATLLFREKLATPEIGRHFRQLAEKQGMPLLTQQHQEYIKNFTVEYVEDISTGRLQEELGLSQGISISPSHKQYNPFLAELSKKIRVNSELQFAVFRKYTRYQALAEITAGGKDGKPGYPSLAGLATLLFGVKTSSKEVGHHFKLLFIQGTLQSNELRQYLTDKGINPQDQDSIPGTERPYLQYLLGRDYVQLLQGVFLGAS